jgi:hypothetical protein
MFPEQKTIPFAFMAWEKTGRGAGALAVRTSVMGFMFGNRVLFRGGVLVGFTYECRTKDLVVLDSGMISVCAICCKLRRDLSF